MLKMLTEKNIWFFAHRNFAKIFRPTKSFPGHFFRVKTDQEVGEVSRSLFVSILPSEEHFHLLFSIFNLSFFLLQSKNENLRPDC